MTASHNAMNQLNTLGSGGKTRVAGSRRCWTAPAKGAFGDRRRRFLGWRLHSQSGVPRQVGVPAALQHHGNTFGGAKWRQITWATGKTTTFHYNALGERTKMVHVDGGTTRTEYYLYDGPRPIQRRSEGTDTSNIDREYFSGGERRWNTGTGAWVNHHYPRDHLGSVREVLDSSGALLARYDYAPYGERVTRYEASGYSSDVGFTGHFHLPSPVSGQSEILLAHYRAYDPVVGRWLSQDPIGEEGGINLYGYVGGRVAEWTDPLGLLPSVVMRYVNDPPKTEAERTGVVCGALVGPTIIATAVSGPAVVGFRGLIMRNPGTVAKVTAALDETGVVVAGAAGTATVTVKAIRKIRVHGRSPILAAFSRDGKLLGYSHDILLSHPEFIKRKCPELPDGSQVVTILKDKASGKLFAQNSKSIHDNMQNSPEWVQKAVVEYFETE